MKIAVKHADARGVGIFLRELNGTYLATPPGLSAFTGAGRPKPSPVVRLFSYLTPKSDVSVSIDVDGRIQSHQDPIFEPAPLPTVHQPPNPAAQDVEVKLYDLAWARSGDKGNKANIGIIAREPEYLDAIWSAFTPERIREVFKSFLDDSSQIERLHLPGSSAMNILMDRALGGGGAASLRNDAQAKGFAQILLAQPLNVPADIAKEIKS